MKNGGVGAKPPPKSGAGGKAPQLRLFAAYIAHSPHPKPQFPTGPPSLMGGRKGLSQLFNGLLGDFKGFPHYCIDTGV